MGRCFRSAGQTAQAAELFRQGIAVGEQLEQSNNVVKRQIGVLHTGLGDVLADSGDFAGTRQAYEKALEIHTQQKNEREMGVVNGQLGTVAMLEGNYQEAVKRHEAALYIFQALNELTAQVVAWHQLGLIYHKSRQWEAAEQHYRRAATISESQGNMQYAAGTWNQLANVCEEAGKTAEAEDWYKKAIPVFRDSGNKLNQAAALNNLAHLLKNDLLRLLEARQLAEEALEIKKTLDPAACMIWTTYNILAKVTEKQGEWLQSREYRRLARESRFAYAGTQYELKKFAQIILGAVAGLEDAEVRQQLTDVFPDLEQGGFGNLVAAIQRIWQGERDEETLFESLDSQDSMIIMAILEGIKNPDSLQQFMD